MKNPLTKSAVCLLAVSMFCPAQDAVAQTTASCLPSPTTVDCDEPIVAAGMSETDHPDIPEPVADMRDRNGRLRVWFCRAGCHSTGVVVFSAIRIC